jgi:catechol 2,3-dioxygenase-like lactoylglutathione lyase family enzyme
VLSATRHFSITVADLERSLRWYRDLLGLDLVSRQRNENAYTEELIGMPGAVLEIAFVALPGPQSIALELIEYVQPRGREIELPTNVPGVAHIAFVVEDIDAVLGRLEEDGARPVSPPVEIDRGANRGMRACYLRDPDGFTLELMQPPAARSRD